MAASTSAGGTPRSRSNRLIEEVLNGGRLDLIGELFSPELAVAARQWIEPFRAAFPDVEMRTLELLREGDRVAGRFGCSGTHLGRWRGHEPTGRRFHEVDEVYFFTLREARILDAWGLEDTTRRQKQFRL